MGVIITFSLCPPRMCGRVCVCVLTPHTLLPSQVSLSSLSHGCFSRNIALSIAAQQQQLPCILFQISKSVVELCLMGAEFVVALRVLVSPNLTLSRCVRHISIKLCCYRAWCRLGRAYCMTQHASYL